MKLSQYQAIFSYNVADLILYANSIGVALTFGEAYRPQSQQYLYYYGKDLRVLDNSLELVNGKVRSKTLNSKHNKRLAVDFNFFIDGELTYDHPLIDKLGKYWEDMDSKNRWGGNFSSFRDAPHFEMNV